MTRQKIKKVFEEIETTAKLDFALTKGECCNSCTWAYLENEFGKNSHGIYLKYFTYGANKTKWDNNEEQYIAHDLTNEQKKVVFGILSKYFKVDWDMTDDKCIKISNKEQKQ